MLTPFFPIILAYFFLSFVTQLSERNFLEGVSFIEGILVVLIGALLLGQISHSSLSNRSSIQFGTRRWIWFISWSGWVYVSALDQTMLDFLTNVEMRIPITIFFFVLCYWLGDALALHTLSSPIKQYVSKLAMALRIQLPVVLLSFLQLIGLLIFSLFSSISHFSMMTLAEMVISMLIFMIVAPWAMVFAWNAQALPKNHSKYELLLHELEANQTPVSRILLWPTHIVPTITAGVIGIFPGFRYLLISPQLLYSLNPQELRSVIAHEAGHLKYRHLLYFLVGFLLTIQLILLWDVGLFWLEWFTQMHVHLVFNATLSLFTLIIMFRFGVGFLSRNFERQADLNSLYRVGMTPFYQALMKVAYLNGIPTQEKNWHHFGVAERIQYLQQCESSPQKVQQHHQRVRKIQIGLLASLVVFLILNFSLRFDSMREWALTSKLDSILAKEIIAQEELSFLFAAGNQFYSENKYSKAEELYRKVIFYDPQNSPTLNNLAWLLVTEYGENASVVAEAISLARQALQFQRKAYILDTLAEAYLQAGQIQKAYRTSKEALLLVQSDPQPEDAGVEYYQKRYQQIKGAIP